MNIPGWIKPWFKSFEDSGDYDNMDNYRVACLLEHKQILAYQAAYKSGCCGSVDRIIPDELGNLYAVGFNYGH